MSVRTRKKKTYCGGKVNVREIVVQTENSYKKYLII